MNAFESIIATLFELDGYWTRINYKVNLTRDQKKKIGRSSSPRWDLDVIAYSPGLNVLRVIECKSYLDSRGVSFRGFDPETGGTSRYKLFNDPVLRETILDQAMVQMREEGLIFDSTEIRLCLAAPNIHQKHEAKLREHFHENRWDLYDRDWIQSRIRQIAAAGYENSIVSITAKLMELK